jgi:hypothetical protein
MMNKKTKKAQTNEEANREYWERQMPLNLWFNSPFAMLNDTLDDCYKQRTKMGVSDADFERDKAIFNKAIADEIARRGYPDTNEEVDHFLNVAYSFVRSAMTKPDVSENYWPLVACHAALMEVHDAQQKKGFIVDAAMTNVALFAQGMMNIAWKPERMRSSEQLAANQHALIHAQQATNRVLNEANQRLLPKAKAYERFERNHTRRDKQGVFGKAIKSHMRLHPVDKPKEVWNAIKKKLGHKYDFFEPKYTKTLMLEIQNKTDSSTLMKWERFRNLVSEHRPIDAKRRRISR